MATQWGRKETIVWQPHMPVYSYLAIAASILCSVFFLWESYAFQQEPNAQGLHHRVHQSHSRRHSQPARNLPAADAFRTSRRPTACPPGRLHGGNHAPTRRSFSPDHAFARCPRPRLRHVLSRSRPGLCRQKPLPMDASGHLRWRQPRHSLCLATCRELPRLRHRARLCRSS